MITLDKIIINNFISFKYKLYTIDEINYIFLFLLTFKYIAYKNKIT